MLARIRRAYARVRRWWRLRGSRVDYELHRMSYKGGWQTHWPKVVFKLPMERPTADDEWPIDGREGRYRQIRRVDGRIDEVMWTYETDNAEEAYERARRREAQLQRLKQMSVEEAADEYLMHTNELDALSREEIKTRHPDLADEPWI